MVVFAKNLNHSLSRAIALAEEQCYPCATPEHVLLALIDDPDTIPVIQACNVDLERLRSAVEASMPHSDYTSDPDEWEEAERLMLQLHNDGVVACGTFTREEAEARAAQVMDLARQHQHPLRCRVQE
jgi:ATP-dependent Clp protease ATP-binding subunit ClpA